MTGKMVRVADNLNYKAAGVDYAKVDPLKVAAQQAARATADNLKAHGMTEVVESRGESAYVVDIGEMYLASITEVLGTKALVADATRSITGRTHYDSLAQDTVAAAVNDLVTVGATPVSIHAFWAAGGSDWFDDEIRATDLVRGWRAACDACGAAWGGGETPALAGVVEEGRVDLAASCVGVIRPKTRLTLGNELAAGDAIVLLAASGIHANGVSLARKVADRLPRGYATLIPGGRGYGEALLDPTPMYSVVTEAMARTGVSVHYAANVTGHGWRKMMRHPAAFTYRFRLVPPIPPVLAFIQSEAALTPRDAYGTFNMGAGFALYVASADADKAVDTAREMGIEAWNAGVVQAGPRRILIEPLDVEYSAEELKLRDQ